MTDDELFRRALDGEIIGNGSQQMALLVQEVKDLRQMFDLLWQAERRGIKSWQDATGRELTLPDGAGFTVWLLSRLEHADIVIQTARGLGKVKKSRIELDEYDAMALHLAAHVVAYDKEYPTPLNDPDAVCCRFTSDGDQQESP
jgi:hypothetical protein